MRIIHEIDAEALREKLSDPAIAATLGRPGRDALAEYDKIKAGGEDAILYIDRGVLVAGVRTLLAAAEADRQRPEVKP